MEARLRPINAVLGLVQAPHDINPAALLEAGFTLEGLEIPVVTDLGNVVIDVLLFHAPAGLLVLVESKSGANIEDEQAKRYAAATPRAVVRASQVTLPFRVQPSKIVVYASLAEHHDRIRLGLTQARVDFPILSLSSSEITLSGPSEIPPPLAEAFAAPVRLSGPPPSFIKFDPDSPAEVIVSIVRAQLVAALAHGRLQVGVPWLAEQCAPHYPLYGHRAKTQLVKVVGEAARHVAAEEPATFAFLPRRENDQAAIKLLKTPEDLDRRGRTQAYQALARGGRTRKRGVPPPPNQLDLLSELGAVDDGNATDEGDGEEGTP